MEVIQEEANLRGIELIHKVRILSDNEAALERLPHIFEEHGYVYEGTQVAEEEELHVWSKTYPPGA